MNDVILFMPPKPWETKGVLPAHNISQVIQSNPTIKQQIPKISSNSSPSSTIDTQISSTTSSTPLSSGVGSSYGGLGSYGGLSSYGGLGSYGGMGGLGSYGGMGSMYGMGSMGGMYGMGGMGGMQQNPTLMNSMIALQSLGFLINSLCDIARSLDQNYQGIQLFRQSFRNLSSKVQSNIKGGVVGAGQKTKSAAFSIIDFLKKYVLCMGSRDERSKQRSVRVIMAIASFLLILSFYPLLRKLFKLK